MRDGSRAPEAALVVEAGRRGGDHRRALVTRPESQQRITWAEAGGRPHSRTPLDSWRRSPSSPLFSAHCCLSAPYPCHVRSKLTLEACSQLMR